jgi:hypothetical protein
VIVLPRRAAAARAALPARAAAPIDLTGYWVSSVLDRRWFGVSPQKGDIPYSPLNAVARRATNRVWVPASLSMHSVVSFSQLKWRRQGLSTPTAPQALQALPPASSLAGSHLLDFGPAPKAKQRRAPSWRGDPPAEWQFSGCAVLDLGGLGFVAGGGPDPGAPPKGNA